MTLKHMLNVDQVRFEASFSGDAQYYCPVSRDVARGCNGCQCTHEIQRGPRGPITRLCGVTVVNFLGIHTRLPAAKRALLGVRGCNQYQPSQMGPLG